MKIDLTTERGVLVAEEDWSWVFTTSKGHVRVLETVPARPPDRMETGRGEKREIEGGLVTAE